MGNKAEMRRNKEQREREREREKEVKRMRKRRKCLRKKKVEEVIALSNRLAVSLV